jgi:TonB family protein
MLNFLAAPTIATLGPAQGAHMPASCIANHEEAHIIEAVPVEFPPLARSAGLHGTAVIRFDLTEAGRVERPSVLTTSGSGILDQAALNAVDAMRYAPETQSCQPVTGTYAVEVNFPAG